MKRREGPATNGAPTKNHNTTAWENDQGHSISAAGGSEGPTRTTRTPPSCPICGKQARKVNRPKGYEGDFPWVAEHEATCAYIKRAAQIRAHLKGEVELTAANLQRIAKRREKSRAMLRGRVTKLVPDDRIEQLIQAGGAA